MSKLDEIIDIYSDEEIVSADGYDDAILGIDEASMRLIYSVDKCLKIMTDSGETYEDALEFFNFNVKSAYMGEKTPIWCDDF